MQHIVRTDILLRTTEPAFAQQLLELVVIAR